MLSVLYFNNFKNVENLLKLTVDKLCNILEMKYEVWKFDQKLIPFAKRIRIKPMASHRLYPNTFISFILILGFILLLFSKLMSKIILSYSQLLANKSKGILKKKKATKMLKKNFQKTPRKEFVVKFCFIEVFNVVC